MNCRLASFVIVAVFVSMVFAPVLSGDNAAADGPEVTVDVTATVVAVPEIDVSKIDIVTNTGDANYTVEVKDGRKLLKFSVSGEPGDVITVAFRTHGYAVREYVLLDLDDGMMEFMEVLEITIPDADKELQLIVFMHEAKGPIRGTLWWDGNRAGRGITVEAYDPVKDVLYTTKTDNNGDYLFAECPVGASYIVSVVHPVREAESREISDLTEHGAVIDFTLMPKRGTVFLFGLDLTHSLMVIGGLTGLFLLIFVILYRIHIDRNPSSSKVYSGTKKKYQK